jgi:hypothetical protein
MAGDRVSQWSFGKTVSECREIRRGRDGRGSNATMAMLVRALIHPHNWGQGFSHCSPIIEAERFFNNHVASLLIDHVIFSNQIPSLLIARFLVDVLCRINSR